MRRSGVKIKGTFFVDLGLGIGRGENLDADLGSACEYYRLGGKLRPGRGKPGNVERFDTVTGRNCALRQRLTVGQELMQQPYDGVLAAGMAKAGWRSHDDVSVAIGLDAVRQPSQPGVLRELDPASQVEGSLRLEIRKFDADRHHVKIRRKWKSA
jgi:hypothetical protein